MSDLRGEISGCIEMAQLFSATSRETTYWFLCYSFPVFLVFRLCMRKFSEPQCFTTIIKKTFN